MSDPIERYVSTKEAARAEQRQNEHALWEQWKSGGEQPHHLEPLLKIYEPKLEQKVRAWKAPNISKAAFKLELQDHLIRAFRNYNPERGAALNTHVEMRLQKAKRYNTKQQNMAYIPEGKSGKISVINRAKDHLTDELGREPTINEIGDYTGLRPKMVEQVQKAQIRDILGSSFEHDMPEIQRRGAYEDQQLAVVANTLPLVFPNKPEFHALFNHVFGTNDYQKITSTTELAKKLGKNQSQIARMKTQMGNHLQKQFGLKPDIED